MALLFNEPPLVIQKTLVARVGVLEALIAQQLQYWLGHATSIYDGERWVYKTYGDWAAEIGVSSKAIRGALDRLRQGGIVVAIPNPLDSRDRTLWWRIDYAVLYGDEPAPDDHSGGLGSPSAPTGRPASGSPNGQLSPAPQGTSRARVPSPSSTAQDAENDTEITTENARERATLELVHSTVASSKPMRYRGRRVPVPIADGAERLLAVFASETGRTMGARTAAGDPSPALKQVVGAMLARPDTSVDDWEAAIRRTVAAPPRWVEGQLQVGHVFGERAAEWALSGGGDPGSRVDEMIASLQAQGL